MVAESSQVMHRLLVLNRGRNRTPDVRAADRSYLADFTAGHRRRRTNTAGFNNLLTMA